MQRTVLHHGAWTEDRSSLPGSVKAHRNGTWSNTCADWIKCIKFIICSYPVLIILSEPCEGYRYLYIYTYKYLLLIYLYHNLVYHSLWSLCQETNCFIAVLKLGRPLATSSIHDLKANRQRRIVPLRSTRSLLSSPHDAKLARKAYLKNSNDLTTLEAWIKVLGLSSLASYAHTAASFWVVKNFTVSRHHTCKKDQTHIIHYIHCLFTFFPGLVRIAEFFATPTKILGTTWNDDFLEKKKKRPIS